MLEEKKKKILRVEEFLKSSDAPTFKNIKDSVYHNIDNKSMLWNGSPLKLNTTYTLVPDNAPAEQIAESVYDIHIKKGILYAPHPAFAKDDKGEYLYHHLAPDQLGEKRSPWDFAKQGTRELVADDYVYAFKRHATTRIEAPIYAIFSEYLLGLKEYGALIKAEDQKLLAGRAESSPDKPFLDFRQWPLAGAQALDSHTLRLRIKGCRCAPNFGPNPICC